MRFPSSGEKFFPISFTIIDVILVRRRKADTKRRGQINIYKSYVGVRVWRRNNRRIPLPIWTSEPHKQNAFYSQ